MKTFWDLSFLDSFQYNSSHCTNSHNAITVTIISNSTLPFISCFILQQTDYLLLADGGANRLLAYLRECHNFVTDSSLEVAVKQLACFKNNKVWIIGDCDSITFSSKHFFESIRVPIKYENDQSTTDLQKCLIFLMNHFKNNETEIVLNRKIQLFVIGGDGGRVDHLLSNLSEMYRMSKLIKKKNVIKSAQMYLITDHSISFVLNKGYNKLHCTTPHLSKLCSFIPLVPTTIEFTTGLHWNMHNKKMRMGKLVSISNQRTHDSIALQTSHPLLCILELHFDSTRYPNCFNFNTIDTIST